MKQLLFLLLSAVVLFVCGCTEPITVGSGLLDDDRAEVGQTMELDFTTTVVREDSILTFDAATNAPLSLFNFGSLSNEVFGSINHSVFITPRLPINSATGFVIAPPFAFEDDSNVDSVVLIIPIDTATLLYGSGDVFPITMRAIAGLVDDNQDYYSAVDIPTTNNELQRDSEFSGSFTTKFLFDTMVYSGDTVSYPHIRLAFNDEFVQQLNALPSSAFDSDTTFAEFFSGIHLETTAENGSLITLRPLLSLGGRTLAGIYYHYQDTVDLSPAVYRTPLSLWLPRYEQDFDGTLFGDKLVDGEDNESFVLAGQGGLMTAITFADSVLNTLEDVVINEAQLTFYREDVDGLDYSEFAAPTFDALFYRNDDTGLLTPIEDQRLLNSNNPDAINQFLGGNPVEDADGNIAYKPRFTVHLQRMIEGDVPRTIYLRNIPTDRDPSRVVLRGPTSPTLPASVRVVFTKLD